MSASKSFVKETSSRVGREGIRNYSKYCDWTRGVINQASKFQNRMSVWHKAELKLRA